MTIINIYKLGNTFANIYIIHGSQVAAEIFIFLFARVKNIILKLYCGIKFCYLILLTISKKKYKILNKEKLNPLFLEYTCVSLSSFDYHI